MALIGSNHAEAGAEDQTTTAVAATSDTSLIPLSLCAWILALNGVEEEGYREVIFSLKFFKPGSKSSVFAETCSLQCPLPFHKQERMKTNQTEVQP